MSLLSRFKNWLTDAAQPPTRESEALPRVAAKYDAAQTNEGNERHWMAADALSVNAANDPGIQAKLRNRGRYEFNNNSYLRGMALTLGHDVIGNGPRLQMLTKDKAFNAAVEIGFKKWCEEIRLAVKLRTMRMSLVHTGEGLLVRKNNSRLRGPIKLDVVEVEADRLCSPLAIVERAAGTAEENGIIYDVDTGAAVEYLILRNHPGGAVTSGVMEFDTLSAADVFHDFRPERPEQRRGIPEVTPALELFAKLRTYTSAVVSAARTAARMSWMIYTDYVPSDFEAAAEFDPVPIYEDQGMTLPAGYKPGQMKAEQPTTTYGEFKREILSEIARCLNMPFNVAAGNSSSYNYASGTLDHILYRKAVSIDRDRYGRCASWLLRAWLDEARFVDGLLPKFPADFDSHAWFWDGWEARDPVKEKTADQIALESGTTTYAELYARDGKDWQQQFEQRAREEAEAKRLGFNIYGASPTAETARVVDLQEQQQQPAE